MLSETNLSQIVNQDDVLPEPEALTRLKFHFLASLNHEIRTPLTGILGMADLLLETELSVEQRDYVDAAKACAENLFEILNATLEFTALSAGNLVLEHTEFALRDTLRDVVEEYRPLCEAKDLVLRVVLDDSLPEFALGDAQRLRQLAGCLVSNATKFTHVGNVTVDAAAETDPFAGMSLVVTVIDTGIGIEADALATIFESFRQLESGLARNYNGLGLGLAIAQKLAHLMGGVIEAHSVAGEGSRFWFRIPLQAVHEGQAVGTPVANGENSYRLLVVDDNQVARDVVKHVLSRQPYAVDFADSGPAALNAAKKSHYDLILMDLQMPGMDGLTTTEAIRQTEGHSSVPVLAFTANTYDEVRALCRKHGMQGFVAKPIRAAEMIRTLESILN
jgi:CheY-like chemotaxis protein